MSATTITYNETKLSELILYVSTKMAEDLSFGATMLNKVLFFSDFFAYQTFGEPITGADYMKLKHGPAPRRMLPVQQALTSGGHARLSVESHLGYTRKRLIALRASDVDVFEPHEIALVDEVIDALRGRTAVQVSDLSHRVSVGWQIAPLQSSIPYNSVFLSAERITEAGAAEVERVARELALIA